MPKILVHPSYFPSIAQMVAIAQASHVIFEIEDNYQKQTYRNRAYIANTNGRQLLNIPIKHSKDGNRRKTKDVQIENDFPWQAHHWKSIQTAYRTSPFFEYYEDDLEPLFKQPIDALLPFNLQVFDLLFDLLGMTVEISETTSYEQLPAIKDMRFLVIARQEKNYSLTPYTQVLQAHHGFLPNLSILDLLFNEGPNALLYLESQRIF